VKIAMLLVVRDDADIVGAHLAFHLNTGVDVVVVTDHGSTDGTADLLEPYARDGSVRVLRRQGDSDDRAWRRDMARLAIDELGADWIIDSQVDEFWLPRAEGMKELLAVIPARYGAVQALAWTFVPLAADAAPFWERMTVRTVAPALDLEQTLRPIVRATPRVAVGESRLAAIDGRAPLRAWYPVEVFRFPLRDPEQAALRLAGRSGATGPRSEIEERFLTTADTLDAAWRDVVVDTASLEHGLAEGTYVQDKRLCKALRSLENSGEPALRGADLAEDAAYASVCSTLREVDVESLVLELEHLEQRLARLERAPWRRIRRRLARRRSG
jgi:hypothetical protein